MARNQSVTESQSLVCRLADKGGRFLEGDGICNIPRYLISATSKKENPKTPKPLDVT